MKLQNLGKGCQIVWGVLGGVILVAGLILPAAAAETFPAKEIEVIINFAPGGSTDMMARIVGNKMSKLLGVPVVMVNKPGGGGAIASNYVAGRGDGYTIGTAGASNLGTLLATSEKMPYTLKDFSGVARVYTIPMILVTKKGRFENFAAAVKEAKQKPGGIIFGSWGSKSTSHIVGELINQVVGIKMKHLSFEGGAKAMVAAMGGHIDIAISTISTSQANLKAGNLTALAVTSPDRVEDFPDVPTLKDLGYGAATFVSYDGLVASAKVPKDRLAIINGAVEKSVNDPEIKDALRKAGMFPDYLSGAEYEAYLAKNLDMLKQVALKAGIKD
jgi:tripartite-type tricarboxylate transporter receptor subunit TctC